VGGVTVRPASVEAAIPGEATGAGSTPFATGDEPGTDDPGPLTVAGDTDDVDGTTAEVDAESADATVPSLGAAIAGAGTGAAAGGDPGSPTGGVGDGAGRAGSSVCGST
jgi:hypothetical protein